MLLEINSHGNEPSASDGQITPQEFRAASPPSLGFALASAEVSIRLFPHPRRAHFRFDCVVKASPEAVALAWDYVIPAAAGDITNVRACDPNGGLETLSTPIDHKATKLSIRFRREVSDDEVYRFTYEYESTVHAVVATGAITQTIGYTGWVVFSIPCDRLSIAITLPPRSTILEVVPLAKVSTQGAQPEIRYEDRVRERETTQWLVGYRQTKVGAPLFYWTGGAIGTGLIGWMINVLLGG